MDTKKQLGISKEIFQIIIAIIALIVGFISCDDEDYTFVPDPILPHTISSINPEVGEVGNSIMIMGTNFSPVRSNNKVSFNGVSALVTAATPTALTVTVPEGATAGPITVSHYQLTVTGPIFNIISIPTISEVSPTSGAEGDIITITGTKFSDIIDNNSIVINGIVATITEATETSITTSIPIGSTAGSGDITVTIAGQTATFSGFDIVPVITAIDPLTGEEGDTITITGTSFSTTAADNIIDFNGTPAVVTMATGTSITTTVPTGATTGAIGIMVNGQTATGPDFTIEVAPTDPITLVIPIDNENDDAEEVSEVDPTIDPGDPIPMVGDMDLGSSDLEFGEISSNQGLQNIGLRFNNVTIPQGASVTQAMIQFKCDDDGSDPVEVTIYGEAVDNAQTFEETNGNISARPLTTTSVVWSIEPWLAAGDRLDAQKTVDLSSIVQEIVNRPGWVSGNSICIIMKHTGVSVGATSSSTGREAENYSSSTPDDGAELTVIYQ